MKIENKILIGLGFCFLCFFVSCELDVYFEDANPPGVAEISNIPNSFMGSFECESDGTRIHAYSKLVIEEHSREFVTSIQKVKETENCSIIAGGLYLPGRKECIPFEYINDDSIKATIYTIDTLFSFSPDQVAKLYKGRLFLNMKNGLGEWMTFMLSPQEDNSLRWELIDVPNDIEKIKDVSQSYTTRVTDDKKTKYTIKTSLANFEEIISRDFTRECDILIPISKRINY